MTMKRFYCPKPLLSLSLKNRTYLITGVSKGLGKILAKQLLKQGATVHGLSRSRPDWRDPNLVWHNVDLSDLNATNQFCEHWSVNNERLDGLINNAAVIPETHTLVKGCELQWIVNYLSVVQITTILGPKLESSSGRVINISSTAHHSVHDRLATIFFDDIHSKHRSYDQWSSYAQSKLALTIYTRQFAANNPTIPTISINPGWVATGIASGRIPKFLFPLFYPLLRRKGLCTEWEGVQPTLAALLLPTSELHSGEMLCQIGDYDGFSTNGLASHVGWLLPSPNPIVYDNVVASRLEELTQSQLREFLTQSVA